MADILVFQTVDNLKFGSYKFETKTFYLEITCIKYNGTIIACNKCKNQYNGQTGRT